MPKITKLMGDAMDSSQRVLLVDDNATNLDILRRILRKEFALDSAMSGAECLEKISVFRPHLVLLDIMMPGLDGYQTCRQIKTSEAGRYIQVILVSGKGTTADRLRGYEVLADDYIVKPFDHVELLSKVRAYFRLRTIQAERMQQSVQESFDWFGAILNQMKADVREHTLQIEAIQQEFSDTASADPDAFVHTVVRLGGFIQSIRERLESSEARLREQAREGAVPAPSLALTN